MKRDIDELQRDYYKKAHSIGRYQNITNAFDKFKFSENFAETSHLLKRELIRDKAYEVKLNDCWASS